MMDINRIFGVGLPKTGTVTLDMALNILGFNSLHFGSSEANEIREKMYRGIYRFDALEKYIALTNAVESIYPQIDIAYPNSKFILTTRSKETWLKSIETHWVKMVQNLQESDIMSIHHHLITFGCYFFNKDRFSYIYDLHNKNVLEYFSTRPDDLLIVDWAEGDGWQILCKFLDKDIPKYFFPHLNRSN